MADTVFTITETLLRGGAEKAMKLIAEGIAEAGLKSRLYVLTDQIDSILKPNSSVSMTVFQEQRIGFFVYAKTVFRLMRYLWRYRPSLVITAFDVTGFFVILAVLLSCRWNTRVIVNSHTTVSLHNNKKKLSLRLIYLFLRWLYALPRIIPANVSQGAAEDSEKYFHVPHVRCLYNPLLKNEDLSYSPRNTPHHFFNDSKLIPIVACGRLEPVKNYAFMLRVFAEAAKQQKQLRLIIVGEGSCRSELEQLVNDLGISEYIDLTGQVDNPQDYMYYARFIWLSSHYEGMPNVLIEALSMGTPVVSSDCPHGPAEIIDNNTYGMLIKKDSVDAYANKILKAVSRFENSNRKLYRKGAERYIDIECMKHYLNLIPDYLTKCVQREVTAIIKTFERPKALNRIYQSIRAFYPEIPIVIVDDSHNAHSSQFDEKTIYIHTEFDIGLAAGRNKGVAKAQTPYCLILDDDFVFTRKTRIEKLYMALQNTGLQIASGRYLDEGKRLRFFEGYFNTDDADLLLDFYVPVEKRHGYPVYDFAQNFFLAETQLLQEHPWDEELKVSEHEELFWRLHLAGIQTGLVKDVYINHFPESSNQYYNKFRNERFNKYKESACKKIGVKDIVSNGQMYNGKYGLWGMPGKFKHYLEEKKYDTRLLQKISGFLQWLIRV